MEDNRRIINTELKNEDIVLENNLRPHLLKDYIGQTKAKESLKIFIDAAKKRKDSLDHTLFYGPPGLGKTTLATILANEMNVNIKITSGPAMGKGPTARSIRLDLPRFTLIGATTRAGMLSAPLRDRFGLITKLDFYSYEELKSIVFRSSKVLGVNIDDTGADEIARRSRGTPRLANRLLKRVRDYAEVRYDGNITEDIACEALDLLEVDRFGLDKNDREFLLTIVSKFEGGPVGLTTLAAALGEDSGTIEDVYEPYLLKSGLINRTPKGRVVTSKAYEVLSS